MTVGRRRSPRARLAAAGHDPDRAVRVLAHAGLWPAGPDGPSTDHADGVGETVWELVEACGRVAAPEDALQVLADLAAEHPDAFVDVCSDEAWRDRVVAVAGTSGPLGRLLAQHPAALRALERDADVEAEQVGEVVELAVRQAGPGDDRARAVATIRRHVTAAIAARDLTERASVDQVASDLAALAEGVLTGTLAAVHDHVAGEEHAARIAVIGMGKLGGQELNYVSDVDVVYVHAPTGEGEQAERAASREATEVLTEVMRILNASTTMGRAYEIDPTLRPEGRHGALSRTLDGFEAYWDRWAKTWEFQALLKARPVAGDRELGRAFVDAAASRVWPERLEPGVVDEIRRMKARVEAKPEVRRDGERQVKLGPGGLRDIEFAVQLLQLVHGRHDRRLRLTGTLPALTALANGGYVADEDASAFSDAYRQLRRVEHRLQLAHERRTHTIPQDDERRDWLARSLGYRATADAPAREPFLRDLRRVQATVRDLHAKLFYRPLLEVHAAVPAEAGRLSLPGQVHAMGEDAAHDRLRLLGFRDPVRALRDIAALTQGMSRSARAVRAALPAVLHRLSSTPDPDGGLDGLRRVLEAHGSSAPVAPMLRDHPPAAELLARVLGASPRAGELLAALPAAVPWLEDEEVRTTPRSRDDLVRMAAQRMQWQDREAALRRFKRQELLRVVLRDLAGWSDVTTTSDELTALGEACLEVGLEAVVELVVEEPGLDGPPADVAVIGMGKFGGSDLHYCSDLDVLFVHQPRDGAAAETVARFAKRVGEEVIGSLGRITAEGTAFEVDADLRPEGRNGPLSRSLDAYRAYYERWSDPWEHQALLRARPVAGDPEVGLAFAQLVEPLAVPPGGLDDRQLAHLRKLKARLERERVPRRADPARHLKMGPGGMADVEWTVQLLQMQHGATHPEVLARRTTGAVEGLRTAGLLADDEAEVLVDAYDFLTRVRNALYLRGARSVDELPRPGREGTEVLARTLGYEPGEWQAFEDDHARHRRRVRAVCERRFFGMEAGPGGPGPAAGGPS